MKDIPLTTFLELGLDPALLKALESEGYASPTPIQAKAIPGVMAGRDLLGIAQTGTGKTAAFALPILHRLNKDRRPAPRRGARALILSPTRELATQIGESFRTYGRHLGFSVAVVFGGVAHKPQRDALARGLDVLIATPGRLLDHLSERNASIETTEILVLDEADQMLDMGFIRPIRQILAKLPARRQSLFFSATMPHEIGALAAEMLREPLNVSVTPVAKTADRVAQKVIFVEAPRKKALLAELFADPAMSRTLVFTRTKRGADRVARYLETAGVGVAAIHGNKSQSQRERALDDFKSGRIRGLIATDIAARGIDIDLVTHVVNFELPNIPESYVHRIGRTARAGAEGIAISFCDGEERAYLRDIQRLTRQDIPSEDRRGDTTLAAEQRSAQPSERGGDGRDRGSDARRQREQGGRRHDQRRLPRAHHDEQRERAPAGEGNGLGHVRFLAGARGGDGRSQDAGGGHQSRDRAHDRARDQIHGGGFRHPGPRGHNGAQSRVHRSHEGGHRAHGRIDGQSGARPCRDGQNQGQSHKPGHARSSVQGQHRRGAEGRRRGEL